MSNQYNKYERLFSKYLSKSPFIKSLIKEIYSRISYFLNKPTDRYISDKEINSILPDKRSSFFGYYDKSPVNSSGLILVHSTDFDTRKKPNSSENITISVITPENIKKKISDFTSSAFNWQQGSRAQWVTDDEFIYNDFDDYKNIFISKLVSISTNQVIKEYLKPIQDGFKNKYFLSINYQRLYTLRPDYGYNNLGEMSDSELNDLSNDGIWKVDYETKEFELILSLESIINYERKPEFLLAKHKVNHVMISPCGKRFVFLHRYFTGSMKYDRLIMANSEGVLLSILSDFEMISHYYWMNEKELITYMRGPNGMDGFFLINIFTNSISSFSKGAYDERGDGHPHAYNDFIIIDTYPNKARMQILSKIDINTGKEEELGQFFHSFEFKGQSRCDLHPRMSLDGKYVYFDSVFSGDRQLYQMKL